MKPRITISIPTYNRCGYLSPLLENIADELTRNVALKKAFQILVLDNCSEDTTEVLCGTYTKRFPDNFTYHKNAVNIGMCKNFIECVKRAQTEYVWIVGDDEVILKGGLERVNEAISLETDIIYLGSEPYDMGFDEVEIFPDYQKYIERISKVNPKLILATTLLTACVFRKRTFDCDLALRKVSTHYSHTYATTMNRAHSVAIFPKKVFRVRDERPEFAEPINAEVPIEQNKYMAKIAVKYHSREIGLIALSESIKSGRRRFKRKVGLYALKAWLKPKRNK